MRFATTAGDEREPVQSLRHVREQLVRAVEEQPESLPARFERYIEVVAIRSAYRLESARGQLELGFEQMAAPLLVTGSLDRRSLDMLHATLDHASAEARTTADLFASYRRAVADVAAAVASPARARRDRSLRRAVELIRERYHEQLSVGQVARAAGFTPDHFSKLFKEREGVTFEHYLRGLRLERARRLLGSTSLDVSRIAELSGFNSLQYFCRVFARASGMTPTEYRRKPKRIFRAIAEKYKRKLA
jgi:AraC-like DNA-binding protein